MGKLDREGDEEKPQSLEHQPEHINDMDKQYSTQTARISKPCLAKGLNLE